MTRAAHSLQKRSCRAGVHPRCSSAGCAKSARRGEVVVCCPPLSLLHFAVKTLQPRLGLLGVGWQLSAALLPWKGSLWCQEWQWGHCHHVLH